MGEEVTEAIITVPAYFDDNQRQATKDAGKIAGLDVLRIINEPTAAALAYGYSGGSETKKVLVFDLGGGTFDVSILDVDDAVIQVISTSGDNHLGGDIWDSTFCEWLCDKFQAETGVDPRTDTMVHSRVLEAARKAKEDLSSSPSVQINLPFLTVSGSTPLHMDYEVTREQFEEITKPLLDRLREPVEVALKGTEGNPIGLTPDDIDEVLLVGGSTRIPSVQRVAKELLGKDPNATVNPDEVVSAGAAVQGSIMNNETSGIVLADVNSFGIGIKLADGTVDMLIQPNTQIPVSSHSIYTNEAKDQRSVQILVIQGNNTQQYNAPENKILGETYLDGLPPAEAHELEIEVEIEYDVDGIIHISAKELSTGISLQTTIEGTTKLTDDEVKSLASAEKKLALGSA